MYKRKKKIEQKLEAMNVGSDWKEVIGQRDIPQCSCRHDFFFFFTLKTKISHILACFDDFAENAGLVLGV